MFWAKMPDGHITQVIVSDIELSRFVEKMELLTMKMLREAQVRQETGLLGAITELRVLSTQLMRASGRTRQDYIDLHKLELKLKAFELQMGYRNNAPSMESMKNLYQQFQKETTRFKKLLIGGLH